MRNVLPMRVRLRCPQEHTSATGFTLPDDPSDPSQKVVIALKGAEGKPQPPAEIECDCYMAAMGRYPIPLYPGKNGGTAGLIFRPIITRVSCGKPVDSVGTCKVWGGWCKASRIRAPWNEAQDKMCAWRPADFGPQLQRLTDYQAATHSLDDQYNEIVLPAKWWVDHLPDVVEAIFGDRAAHGRFLAAYAHAGVSARTHPYVYLNRNDWHNPIK